jgi:hypothetical protein
MALDANLHIVSSLTLLTTRCMKTPPAARACARATPPLTLSYYTYESGVLCESVCTPFRCLGYRIITIGLCELRDVCIHNSAIHI